LPDSQGQKKDHPPQKKTQRGRNMKAYEIVTPKGIIYTPMIKNKNLYKIASQLSVWEQKKAHQITITRIV
jgi:hypothetical protein